jgi:hypothetical protein
MRSGGGRRHGKVFRVKRSVGSRVAHASLVVARLRHSMRQGRSHDVDVTGAGVVRNRVALQSGAVGGRRSRPVLAADSTPASRSYSARRERDGPKDFHHTSSAAIAWNLTRGASFHTTYDLQIVLSTINSSLAVLRLDQRLPQPLRRKPTLSHDRSSITSFRRGT